MYVADGVKNRTRVKLMISQNALRVLERDYDLNTRSLNLLQNASKTKVLLVVRYRYEGWHGFYKGLSINLSRVIPATVLTFTVYENVFHYLRGHTANEAIVISSVPGVDKLKE